MKLWKLSYTIKWNNERGRPQKRSDLYFDRKNAEFALSNLYKAHPHFIKDISLTNVDTPYLDSKGYRRG